MKTRKDFIINTPQDCDNAPKRRVIRDFVIAFYKKDWQTINEKLEDKFTFKIIGDRTIDTGDELIKYLDSDFNVIELTIHDILSHGKYGACNGIIKCKKEEINFAYFFEFQSAGKNSIKAISEYIIKDE
ncbi:MAG: hypothetical protein RSF34_11150 [Flavobacterium sp.]|uniref:hypothetical protein n=1 Tax=Flavobacterium sp. TaxID=239 RepID=UPI002FCB2CE0